MEYKMIRLDNKTYSAIEKMAEENNRTLVGQIRHMVRIFENPPLDGYPHTHTTVHANPEIKWGDPILSDTKWEGDK